MNRKRRRSTRQVYRRSFILSFFLSLLTLCSVTAFCILNGKNIFLGEAEAVQGTAEVPYPTSSNSVYSPIKESDCLTVLFMGVKDSGSISNTYLLARFDPVNDRIPVVSLPPQTMVVKPEGDQTPEPLWEVYRYGGRSLAVKALSHTLNIPIDRYVVIDLSSFRQVSEWIGSVQYSLRYPLNYQDSERTIRLTQGLQLVDGQKAIDIVTYPNYAGGETTRAEITAELAVKIINDKLNLAVSGTADRLFKQVVNLVDTDITYKDFEIRKTAISHLTGLKGAPAISLPLDGGWPNTKEYRLSQRFLEQIEVYFGTRSGENAPESDSSGESPDDHRLS